MKVLVAGRSGQIARSLIEAGAGRPGIELIALGRPELDLELPETIGAAIAEARPGVVINAAAYTAVDRAEDEAERAFRINAQAVGEIARHCRDRNARLIHISTDYVFDGDAPGPYTPDAPTNPLGAYGRSKLGGEHEVRAQMPDHLIVRTAWVYSPFSHNFVKTMMRLGQSQDVVRVVADQRGNPSSALDIAEGLLGIVGRWRDGDSTGLGATYHLAGTGTTSWADFAGAIFAACERHGLPAARVEPIITAQYPTRAQRPHNSMLDSSRFTRDFGFQMPDWHQSLDCVVDRLAAEAAR